MRFTSFACFDWSGAATERPAGIALAIAGIDGPPRLVERRWSRAEALAWLRDIAGAGEPMLIGADFSFALPFVDAGAYFPAWFGTPPDAAALWAMVEAMSAADDHLGVASVLRHPEVGRYFRQHGGLLGDRFGSRGGGRLRAVERQTPGATSCFNLVGPAQVGKASLTGMRLLHALRGVLPIWPFDPLPERGPVLVEVYTTIAARAAGIGPGRSKMRDADTLGGALAWLGSPNHAPLAQLDDHMADAILTAAWLRTAAHDLSLWTPPALTQTIAATEGWTFGVA